MTLEELQIVISLQTDNLSKQVNSVLTQVNSLSSSIASTTAGATQQFSSMGSAMASALPAAAMAGSMQGAFKSATDSMSKDINNLSKTFAKEFESMPKFTIPVDADISKAAEDIVKDMDIVRDTMDSSISGMTKKGQDVLNISQQIAKENEKLLSSTARLKELEDEITAKYKELTDLTGSISEKTTAGVAPSESEMNQANALKDEIDKLAGEFDRISDAAKAATNAERDLNAAYERATHIYIDEARELGTWADGDKEPKDDDSMKSSFKKMIECCTQVQQELVEIKDFLRTHMSGSGDGSSRSVVPTGSNGSSGGGSRGIGMFGNLRNIFGMIAALGIGILIKDSIKEGMDAVESESLFNTIYGGKADSMRQWSNNFNSNSGQQMYSQGPNTNLKVQQDLGLNPYAMRENSGIMYAMAQSMGLTSNNAMSLSKDMSMLSNDMASFYNISQADAFEKLRSGISGETEPLKQLGILVNDTMVKQYAYTTGMAKQGATLSETQKVMARYALIMKETAAAQGDLGRTINSPANQLRLLTTQLTMLKINLGNAFLPILTTVLPILTKFVQGLNVAMQYVAAFMQCLFGTNKNANSSVKSSNAIASANKNVADSYGKIATEAQKAKGSLSGFDEINELNFQKAEKATDGAGAGPDTTDTVIGTPGGGNGMLDSMANLPAEMQKKMQDMANKVKDVLKEIFKPFKEGWDIYGPSVQKNAEKLAGDIGSMFKKVGTTLHDIWVSPQMQESVKILVGIFADLWQILVRIIDELVKPIWNAFFDMLNPKKNPAASLLLTVFKDLLGAIKAVLDYLAGDGFGIVKTFLAVWTGMWVTNKIFEVGTAIKGVITTMKEFQFATWIMEGDGVLATFLTNMKSIAPFFAGLGGTISGAFASIGTFFSGLGSTLIGFLAPVGEAVMAVVTAVAAALGIPVEAAVALIAAAVAAITLGIYELVKHWDDVKKWFQEAWKAICDWSTAAWKGIVDIWNGAGPFFASMWDGIKTGATAFWDELKNLGSLCWNAIKEIWSVITDVFKGFWDGVTSSATAFWNELKNLATVCWNGIKAVWNVITTVFKGFWDAITSTGKAFWDSLQKLGEAAWNGIKKAWDVIENVFKNFWNGVTATGKAFWNGLQKLGEAAWDGIKKAWDVIEKVFQGFWDGVTKTGKAFWDALQKLGEAAWNGIKKAWDVIEKVFQDFWDTITKSGTKFWNGLGKLGKNAWSGIKKAWEVIGNVFQGFWNGVTKTGGTFWTGLTNKGKSAWTDIKNVWNAAGGFFSGIWSKVTTSTSSAWKGIVSTIKGAFGDIKEVFNGIISFISGTFRTGWDKAWNGVVSGFHTIVSGIANVFKAPINAIIDGINDFIKGVNKIKVPSWVPGVGGKGFNMDTIPRLAQGGIIDSPTIAQIGEAGPEAVVPLENTSFVTKLADAVGKSVEKAVKSASSSSSNHTSGDIILQVDSNKFGKVAIDAINTVQRQAGKTLLRT